MEKMEGNNCRVHVRGKFAREWWVALLASLVLVALGIAAAAPEKCAGAQVRQRAFMRGSEELSAGRRLDELNSDVPRTDEVEAGVKSTIGSTTQSPTSRPTKLPTQKPTKRPTKLPTVHPTKLPTQKPTKRPTKLPTTHPTKFPTTKKPTAPQLPPTLRALPPYFPTSAGHSY